MREENLNCDICKKKLHVDYTNYPYATDYWECDPMNKKHGMTMYAVMQDPPRAMQICDDCFQTMLKSVNWSPPTMGEVISWEGPTRDDVLV